MAVMSRETFEEWRKGDDQFKGEARGFFDEQRKMNLGTEHRLTVLETAKTGVSGWLGAMLAAVVTVVKGYFGRS